MGSVVSRPASPPVGYYPDGTAGVRRGWDGHVWTDRITNDPTVEGLSKWVRQPLGFVDHRWFQIAGGGFVIGIVIAVVADLADLTWLEPVASIGTIAVISGFVMLMWERLRFADVISVKAVIGWGLVGGVVAWEIGGVLERSFDHRLDTAADSPLSMLSSGPAEEFGKLVVPVLLYLFGRYRDPRAGLAIALASGAAFGMIEGFEYTSHATAIVDDLDGVNQADQMATALMATQRPLTELMHPIFTGFVAAVAWQAAWPKGRIFTWLALGAFLLAAAAHSLNDFLATRFATTALLSTAAIIIGCYFLAYRRNARRLTPPGDLSEVPPGWRPPPPKHPIPAT